MTQGEKLYFLIGEEVRVVEDQGDGTVTMVDYHPSEGEAYETVRALAEQQAAGE